MNSQSNKAQLREEIIGLLHNVELLTAENATLRAENAAMKARLDPGQPKAATRVRSFTTAAKPKYEFDPNIEGSFKRACALAKINGGIAVRSR